MDSYPRVLVGTDGSPDAAAAVRTASLVATRLRVPLALVAVWDGDRDRGWADGVLDQALAVASELGAGVVDRQAVEGRAPEVLLDRANDEPDQLVVVGSTGLARATSRLVASTSNRLTHHSLADVLFVRNPLPHSWNFVALATDGSKTSYQAVRHGLRLAAALDARARLITAARTELAGDEVLATTAAELGLGDEVEREVLVDPQPAGAIVNAGWKYELVAIGNRGMSGPERLLGSIANKVTHELKTNLLLVNTTRS